MKTIFCFFLLSGGYSVCNPTIQRTPEVVAPLDIYLTALPVPEPAPTQEIMVVQMPSTLATMPYTDLCNVITTMVPAVYQNQLGAGLYFRGGRANEVLYVIDGMQIQDR